MTGARDKLIMLWDVQSGRHLKTLVRSLYLAISPLELFKRVEQLGHDGWIRGLVFHPTGKFLLSTSDDKTIRVWDLATGRCTKTVQAHSHFVSCIAWGNLALGNGATANDGRKVGTDGKLNGPAEAKRVNVVATGSVDLSVKIWTP